MEEDFSSLLEEHLTDEAFMEANAFEDNDDQEEKNTKSIQLEYKDSDMISITYFIKNYLGFKAYEETSIDMPKKKDSDTETFTISDGRQMTEVEGRYDFYHTGLKEMNIPYVIGISHEYANKHPEHVYHGFILLVIDAKGHKATYLNPIWVCEYVNRQKTFDEFKELCENEENMEPGSFKCSYHRLKDKIDDINTMHIILYETHKLRQVNRIEEDEKKERGLK